MPPRLVILAANVGLALAGCAGPTPYQSLVPQRGGYSEQRLSPDRFRVVFTGNAQTRPEQVEQFLLRRAAELTVQNGYDWFRATNRIVEGNVRTIQTSRGPVRVSQGAGYSDWGSYGRFYTSSGLGFLRPIWRRINAPSGEAVEASAEVMLGKGPPPSAEGVVDARRLLREFAR